MPRIKTCEELCFNPSRPDLGWRQKISLNFYFPSFSRCFKSFYDGLKGIWTYFTPCSSVSVVNFWAGKCQLGWVQTIPPQNLKLNYCHLSDWILLEISQGDYLAWKLQLLTSGSWTMLIYKEFSVKDFNGNCYIHLIIFMFLVLEVYCSFHFPSHVCTYTCYSSGIWHYLHWKLTVLK